MAFYFQVAGIDSDSGALLWRHAQETDQLGEVRALKVKLLSEGWSKFIVFPMF